MLKTIFKVFNDEKFKPYLALFIAKIVGLKNYYIDYKTVRDNALFLI